MIIILNLDHLYFVLFLIDHNFLLKLVIQSSMSRKTNVHLYFVQYPSNPRSYFFPVAHLRLNHLYPTFQ